MRPIATIALCGAGAMLVQAAFSVDAQIVKTKEKVAIDTDAILNSSTGCRRRTVGYDDLASELNNVSANPRCKNYVALTGPCPGKLILDHRISQPFASSLTIPTPGSSASQQNALIAQARAIASAMSAPPGMRLYRLTFSTRPFSGGPLPMRQVEVAANYGVCFGGHS